ERHGPLVMGVCRRLLHDEHDAEDAFQAVFLVLARRAASIRQQSSLGSWLYGVAYRVSLETRGKNLQRRQRETGGGVENAQAPWATPDACASDGELRELLADELSRLPDKFRAPLVLCYFQGKTNEEAALELGYPKGTVLSRLARGRDRLRDRLLRRGVALSTASLVAALSQAAQAGTVPTALVAATVQESLSAPAVSSTWALADAVLQTMRLSKLKTTALVCLVLAGLGVGAAGLAPLMIGEPVATAHPTFPRDFFLPATEEFFEDFTGDALDPRRWLIAHKQWGGDDVNGGVVAENVSVADGKLLLEAHGDRYRGPVMGVRKNGGLRVDGRRVGAAIATKLYFCSGRYEVRMKVCPKLGACSALWTLHYEEFYPGHANYRKLPVGGDNYYAVNHEIDIELPGRPGPAKKDMSFQYALCNTFTGENDEESTVRYTQLAAAQNDGQFHTYRFDWHTGSAEEKKRVDFYIDGQKMQTIATHVPNLPGRLWLGVWFPRDWAGQPDFDTERLEVDWVRITPFKQTGDRFAVETFPDEGWMKPTLPKR
ncbi:MAG: sigma-70 family RNA polymerase sigma factor, partial [Planctomycetia bacterium]|nr:sigma-70 family RNA polymerase sigma factor [Planctomycetia bacterium]